MAEAGNLDKATKAKLLKLTEALRVRQTECVDLADEITRLLHGEAGIGEKLKAVEVAFALAWSERYAPGNPNAYQWQYAQDRSQLKRLLKSLAVEELTRRLHEYIRDSDPFYLKARHPFRLFVSGINRYAPASTSDLELEAPPADCRHTPKCSTDEHCTRKRSAEMRA